MFVIHFENRQGGLYGKPGMPEVVNMELWLT